jgi:hypothetical protein
LKAGEYNGKRLKAAGRLAEKACLICRSELACEKPACTAFTRVNIVIVRCWGDCNAARGLTGTYPFLWSRLVLVPPLRRVTLEKRNAARPQSNQKALAPFVRCLAMARHALAPVLLRGPAAIGHPWPGAANPASMPGCPLRRTSTRPLDGAVHRDQKQASYRSAY